MGPGLLLLAAGAALAQLFRASVPWPAPYRALFEEMAGKYGVDENVLHALAWHESGMNPNAVGAKNRNNTTDYGLMQINSANFAALGLTPATWADPRKNIEAAAKLLRDIGRTPGLSVMDTLSIYNAGPTSDTRRPGTPKRDDDGGYVNPAYVAAVYGKYLMVAGAALAPVRG